jgi:outer membrane cobalamin receptor
MKLMDKKILVAIAGMLMSVVPLRADVVPDTTKPDTTKKIYQLPPIVVIGERMNEPASSTSIPKEKIAELKADRLSDLLSQLCGVNLQDYGGIGGVQSAIIRTTGSSARSLVLLNGRPANDPYNGGFNFTLIGPNLLDRLTLYRGPFSHLFGRDALGGLVALTTKSLATDSPYSRIDVARGSFATNRYQFDFGRSLIRNTSMYLASDIEKTRGYRDSSATELYSLAGNISARLGDNFKVRGDLLFHQDNIQTPGQDTALFPPDKKEWAAGPGIQNDKYWDGDLVFQLPAQTQAVVYYTNSRIDYSYANSVSWNHYYTYGSNLSKDFKLGHHEAGLGIDFQQTNAGSSAIGGRSLLEGGGMVRYRFDSNPFIAAATLRFDRLHTGEAVFNPAVKLGYRLKNDALFYAGFGRSFRAPTVTELYWPTDTVWRYRGNPNLKSESGMSFELGSRIKKGWVTFEAAAFQARYKNLITPGMDKEGYYTKLNIDSVTTLGAEGAIAVEPLPGFAVSIAHSQSWADTNLPYTPSYHSSIALEYHRQLFEKRVEPFIRLEAELADSLYDPAWWVTTGQAKLPGYQVFNLLASVKIIDLTIYFRLNNLYDQKYQIIGGYPMPPREWKVGLAWEFWE